MNEWSAILAILGLIFFICFGAYAIYITIDDMKYGAEREYNKCVDDCNSLDLEYASIISGDFKWQTQCICRTEDGDIKTIW